jgi:hypothetical protein
MRAAALCLSLLLAPAGAAADDPWSFSGHAKYRLEAAAYPGNSLYRDLFGDFADDQALEGRFNLSWRRDRWSAQADYQLIGLYGDRLALAGLLPELGVPIRGIISDDRRWFDLTWTLADSDDAALVHRFDRASVGYTGDRVVWRFGRQAVSWGNGLLFTPMDIFNPFDPAAVDREYKTGDDMLYGQYLFGNGSDAQAVAVVRRDPVSGEVEADHSSLAFKYHGFAGANEYDLLAARHYDETVLGIGGSMALGGAVWQSDLTWTDTDHGGVFSAVTSLSYSWTWSGRNVSGLLEYYYNGFGQTGSDYSPAALRGNTELLQRIERGELYTLGRHYLGASATIEVNPLFLVTPTALVNLVDPSALLQLVARYDWRQDLQLIAALNLPVGRDGSEYGGIESPVEERYLSTDASLFFQLAWYF